MRGDIVSTDSVQWYIDLDIGTNKPDDGDVSHGVAPLARFVQSERSMDGGSLEPTGHGATNNCHARKKRPLL